MAVSALETMRHIIADESTAIYTLDDLVLPELTHLFNGLNRCMEAPANKSCVFCIAHSLNAHNVE